MSNLDFKRGLQGGLPSAMLSNHFTPVSVEVIFGAPGKHCHGAGICKVIPVEHVRVHWKCPSARAWLDHGEAGGTIRLIFERSLLSSDVCEGYFGEGMFLVEEAYTFPQAVLSMLNMHSFTVMPGVYSVKVSEDFIVLIF